MLDEIYKQYPCLHSPRDIILEALREFVGDGEGINEFVLAQHDCDVKTRALRDAADDLEPLDWQSAEYLCARATRIETRFLLDTNIEGMIE